jgi:hypothetical protein
MVEKAVIATTIGGHVTEVLETGRTPDSSSAKTNVPQPSDGLVGELAALLQRDGPVHHGGGCQPDEISPLSAGFGTLRDVVIQGSGGYGCP